MFRRGSNIVVPRAQATLLVKAPSGGIAAPSGTTIYGEECLICLESESSTPGEMSITETADTVIVYNAVLGSPAIAGSTYSVAELSDTGVWVIRSSTSYSPTVGIVTFSWEGPNANDGSSTTIYKGYPDVTTSTNYSNDDWEWDVSSGTPSEYGLKFLTAGLYPVVIEFGADGLNLPPTSYDAALYGNGGVYRTSSSSFTGSGATGIMWYFKDLTYNTATVNYTTYQTTATGVGMITAQVGDYAACQFEVNSNGASNGDFYLGAKMMIFPRCNV